MVNTMYGVAENGADPEFMDDDFDIAMTGLTGPAKRDLDFSTATYCTSCHTHKRQRVETPTLGMDLLTIEPVESVCDVLPDDSFTAAHDHAPLAADDFSDFLAPFDTCDVGAQPALHTGAFVSPAASVDVAPSASGGASEAKGADTKSKSAEGSTDLTTAKKKFPGQNTQWSALEETFLVGAVMDWFFRHGSLTPARKGGSGKKSVWDFIKKTFDDWMYKYAIRSGKPTPQGRSAKALNRHYKSMKTSKNPGFYQLYKKFSSYESILRR